MQISLSSNCHHQSVLNLRQFQILPPVIQKKRSQIINFDEKRWIKKLKEQSIITEQFTPINNSTLQKQIKSKRTSSLYSLQSLHTKSDSNVKIKTEKKLSPSKFNQYNKWFIQPNKRFVDLSSQSQEYIEEQNKLTQQRQQQQYYNNLISQSKHLRQFIQEFKKNEKRSPSFIHYFE